MKKLISLVLVFIMLFSITACNGDIPNIDLDGIDGSTDGDGETPDEGEKLPSDIEGGWDNLEPDDHEHQYTDGKCECGETDPSYNPEPDPKPEPEPAPEGVFLLNRAEWDEVSGYYWNMDVYKEDGGWPGRRLALGDNGLYKVETDFVYTHLIFNNNNHGAQTPDLLCPTDDKIVYDNLDNLWLTYDEAMKLLNPDVEPEPDPKPVLPPHVHIYVGGVCECGEADPNYIPEPNPEPHQHNYVGGVCSCGMKDPSYVDPNPAPHEHIFISGKCDCGEVDPNYNPDPEVDEDLAIFNALFDERSFVSIQLKISNSELKKIQKDYETYSSRGSKSPIYRMADLVITITTSDGQTGTWTIPEVGVRMKGNTSRTSFYSDSNGMYNLIHFKISFKETFDDETYYGSDAKVWADKDARKARKDRTFATLEKMDMRWNRNDDTTYIRENYAYAIYREYGILAPHTNLASVDIGKDHAGVWVIYEPVDDLFLEKNLPDSALGGDLYKLGWTGEGATFTSFSSYGVEDEDAGKFYVYDLKTNKKTSTHESLKNLINVMNNRSVTKAQISSLIDMEYFVYYCAISYMIGSPDDLRNNYNNTYIYFRADTGEMLIIPYDMDRGLGVNTWNPSRHGMTEDDPFSTKAIGNNSSQRNPLFLKTVCTGGMFIDEYIEALKDVSSGEMFTTERFAASFNIAANLYSSKTTTSKTYNNASGHKFRFDLYRTCSKSADGNMSFADYITAKQKTLAKYLGTGSSGSGDGGNSGSSGSDNTPITDGKYYISGNMNDWIDYYTDAYALKSMGDGTYTITLTPSMAANINNTGIYRIKFKIRDAAGGWYDYSLVDANCSVNYNDNGGISNGNKNFYLASGTYVLTLDTNTMTVYIEKT